jgi:hypothetical protein
MAARVAISYPRSFALLDALIGLARRVYSVSE